MRGESGPVAYAITADRRKIDNVYNRDSRTVPGFGGMPPREVPLQNVGNDHIRVKGRLDFYVSAAWRVWLLPRISRYETGLDLSSRLPVATEEHKRDASLNLGGIVRYAGTGALSAQIRTSYRYSTQRLFQENFTLAPTRQTTIIDPPGPAVFESVTRGVFPFAALTGQDTDFYSLLVEPQLTWAPNLDHTVVFGASYTREHGAFGDSTIADGSNLLGSDATLARIAAGIQGGMARGGVPNPSVTLVRDPAIGAVFPLSRGQREQFDIFSAYVQDEWALADGLRLVPGVRFDHHSVFGAVGSPKVSLLYAVTPTTRVRTSAGRAFRAPSLFELFGNVVFHGPIPGLPNPDLEPEHITSFDAGIQHEVSRAFRAEMNVFYNDMTDLIQLTISPQRDHFDWVNVAEARSTGLELVANGDATSWLGYYTNYSYTDSEDRATGNALALVPRHKVNAGLQLGAELGSWRLTGSIDQRWVGTRTQSSSGVPVLLDEYARTDLALYLHPNDDLRVGVHVLNVTDADYQETAASPTLGRLVSMSLTVTPF
ncbi:MAG: TonB-dependent receptor [Acidobacteria bacterium]|nr:TonB-dependent receptor [Acidobacteriota bacterium]